MKKKHVILLSLLLAVSAAGLSGCSNSNAGTPEDPVTKVVMVTDTEGMEEGSFDALIWAGVERASRDMGVSVECLESVSEEDYETNLDKAASQGADLVLSAGYLLSDANQAVAARYPDTKFAILDTAGGEADNVLGLDVYKRQVEGKVKAQEKEAFKAAAEALKETPKEPAGLATMVTEEIEFLDVYGKTEEKTIYADLSSEHLNGGSLTERLLIEQVVETLLSSFGEQGYDKVQFLVNGEQAETLMGHMDTMEPFTRFNEEGGGVDAGE